MPIVYLLSAIVIAAAFAAQPTINGAAAKILRSAFPATTLSVAITFLASIIVMIIELTTPVWRRSRNCHSGLSLAACLVFSWSGAAR